MPAELASVPSTTVESAAIDWRHLVLPDAWPDRLRLRRPRDVMALARHLVGPRRPIELPSDLPGQEYLPRYLRQEFHHLPNGNYSKRFVDGYARWFDRLMLGRTHAARARLAEHLTRCRTVLDLGCGAGALAGELRRADTRTVWGIDPSPYLLQIAARRHPGVAFVQGLAEATGFSDASFDGAGACFLFHELPRPVCDRVLVEMRRVLVPGGILAIAEPSPLQFEPHEVGRFVRRHRLLGLYFWLMARMMYEPFATAWHRVDVASWLAAHGFALRGDDLGMPIRTFVASRLA